MTPARRDDSDIETARMPLGEHLEELRRRLAYALIGLLVGTGIALALGKTLIDALALSYTRVMEQAGQDPRLAVPQVVTGFTTYLGVSMVAGFVIASPWILYQMWRFIADGLYRHERRMAMAAVPFSVILFAGGVAFFLLVAAMPLMQFFIGFNRWMGVRSVIMLGDHIRFITRLMLVFGLAFQTPLVVYVLYRTGIASRQGLHRYRRHVVVGSLVVAAVATSPSIVDQVALAIPVWLLYELGLLMTYVFPRRAPRD